MRTKITFLLCALFTAYSHAQQASWQWAKQVGSAGDNNPNPLNAAGHFINMLNTYTGFPNMFGTRIITKLFIDNQNNYFISDGMQVARINTLGVLTNFYNYTTTSDNLPKIRGFVLNKTDNVYVSVFFTDTVNIGETAVSYTNVSRGNNNSIIYKFSPAGSLFWYNTSNTNGVGGDNGLGNCTLDTSDIVLITSGVVAMGTATVFGYPVNAPTPIQSANTNAFYHVSVNTGSFISAKAATMQYVDSISAAYTNIDNTVYCIGTLAGYLAFNTATYTSGGNVAKLYTKSKLNY